MNQQEKRRFFRALSILVTLTIGAQLLLAPVSLAQTDQGRITGTVHDQARAVIGGATVTITNERTGEQRSTTSNDQGLYVIANLKPSTYTLRATANGFGQSEVTGIELLVGQKLTSDIEVKPAGTSETVNVVATEDVGLDTSSARIGANVNAREVQELPFNGRQLSQL